MATVTLKKTEQEEKEVSNTADQLTDFLCTILIMDAPALKSLCKEEKFLQMVGPT